MNPGTKTPLERQRERERVCTKCVSVEDVCMI